MKKINVQYLGSPLTTTFTLLTWASLLGGLTLCYLFWPSPAGYGYTLTPVAYTASIVWLIAGFVQAALFAAVGRALEYLQAIAINSYEPTEEQA